MKKGSIALESFCFRNDAQSLFLKKDPSVHHDHSIWMVFLQLKKNSGNLCSLILFQ